MERLSESDRPFKRIEFNGILLYFFLRVENITIVYTIVVWLLFQLLLPAEATAVLFSASSQSFFSLC